MTTKKTTGNIAGTVKSEVKSVRTVGDLMSMLKKMDKDKTVRVAAREYMRETDGSVSGHYESYPEIQSVVPGGDKGDVVYLHVTLPSRSAGQDDVPHLLDEIDVLEKKLKKCKSELRKSKSNK